MRGCCLLLVTMCLWGGLVWADEPKPTATPTPFFGTPAAAAVLNDASHAASVGKEVVDTTQPAIEELYGIRSGKWHTGTSVALWNLRSHNALVASLRGGYAYDNQMPYAEAQANLPGITTAYVEPSLPGVVKTVAMAGGLNTLWALAGKYGHVGAYVGYALDKGEPAGDKPHGGIELGVALGGRVSF